MSIRSARATDNVIAVSANHKESAVNTEQTLDTSLLWNIGVMINTEPRRESNENEATGHEEPDAVYDLGKTVKVTLESDKAQPQHFAFLGAYGLGAITTAALGSGYKHTETPISGDLDADRSNPSFTGAQRWGKTDTSIMKRRFASMFIDSFKATFTADEWVKISGEVLGTGKVTTNVTEESISAAENATQLTLAANGVQGSDAAARLSNVQRVRVELVTGIWTEVAYSAVSAATPAVITITAPGVPATSRTYKVLYHPTAAAWETFPARVTESPLRISQMSLNVGGSWTGSAFSGGRALTSELNSIEWEFKNNMAVKYVPGAGDAYAGRCLRKARSQKIKLNREFREYIMQQHIDDNDTFGLHIKLTGALYDATYHYQVEIIFPKLALLAAPLSEKDKMNTEEGDLQVLEDATYGSVIMIVQNLVDTYAAA